MSSAEETLSQLVAAVDRYIEARECWEESRHSMNPAEDQYIAASDALQKAADAARSLSEK